MIDGFERERVAIERLRRQLREERQRQQIVQRFVVDIAGRRQRAVLHGRRHERLAGRVRPPHPTVLGEVSGGPGTIGVDDDVAARQHLISRG